MKTILKIIGSAVLIFGLTACEKEIREENLESYDDVVDTELEQRDFEIEDEMGTMECVTYDFTQHFPKGVEIIDTSEGYPKTIIIDYGNGITDKHGRLKSGKVIINTMGEMRESGTIKTITLENFKVGEAFVEGERKVENIGENEAGNMQFSVSGNRVINREGVIRTKTYSRIKEWISGDETCEREDDVFLITGTSNLTSNKRSISTVITTPIYKSLGSCKYPLSGEIKITKGNGKTGFLNFGDGTCNNKAILTLANGKIKEVDLDNRKCNK